ncbi:GNAT family N-acetyltransferase [Streptosporangiaceae bacterium NEAU-GS5]|nr:GNAT family N-acetyltransferase [Streptosporangiaceae bacterium NEAU-GS5]
MNLELRPIDVGDAAELARLYEENRHFLEPYQPARLPDFYTGDGQRRRIEALSREIAGGTRWTALIVLEDETVGHITLNNILRGVLQSAALGYWVAERVGGKGVATAAVGFCLDIAFCELDLHRVEASVRTDNVRSIRVLAKNRFRRIGIAREHVFLDDAWRDEFLFERHAPPIADQA